MGNAIDEIENEKGDRWSAVDDDGRRAKKPNLFSGIAIARIGERSDNPFGGVSATLTRTLLGHFVVQ